MALNKIRRKYEERRGKLAEMLKDKEKLSLSKQHQIYGAVKEIDQFIKTIEFHIEEEKKNKIDLPLYRKFKKTFKEQFQEKLAEFKKSKAKKKKPNKTRKS